MFGSIIPHHNDPAFDMISNHYYNQLSFTSVKPHGNAKVPDPKKSKNKLANIASQVWPLGACFDTQHVNKPSSNEQTSTLSPSASKLDQCSISKRL